MVEESYSFRTFRIFPHMLTSIKRYVQHGSRPGSFLSAVIENNLKKAVMYADDDNMSNLPAYVDYFYNHAPMSCWGYEGVIKDWAAHVKKETKTDDSQ